jgi:uncharacterized delta-60 repeat protein
MRNRSRACMSNYATRRRDCRRIRPTLVRFLLIGALASLLLRGVRPVDVKAASGDLDPSFGAGGKVITYFGGVDQAHKVAVQTDGKLVVVGTNNYIPGNARVALVRYNPNGNLDPTFGSNGESLTDFGADADGYALALEPDGKIVVTGRIFGNFNGYFNWIIARFNSNGSLDTTFGSGGRTITDFGSFDAATAVAIQTDGKIVVAGEADSNFGIARYNPDGTLDSTFGAGGKNVSYFLSGPATAMAIQSDGKIVVVGGGFSYGVARYNSNGTFDSSFGVDGKVTPIARMVIT